MKYAVTSQIHTDACPDDVVIVTTGPETMMFGLKAHLNRKQPRAEVWPCRDYIKLRRPLCVEDGCVGTPESCRDVLGQPKFFGGAVRHKAHLTSIRQMQDTHAIRC